MIPKIKLINKLSKIYKKTHLKIKTGLLFLGLFLLSSPLLFYLGYRLTYWNKIFPFVKVANLDLSGKTKEEAEIILNNFIKEQKPANLKLVFENKNWSLSLEELKLDFSPSSSAEKAFLIGRKESLFHSLEEQKKAFWQKINLNLEISLNLELLKEKTATLAGQINLPAIPPTIQVLDFPDPKTGEKILIKEGEPGRKLNEGKLQKILYQKLGYLNKKPINLPVDSVLPFITPEMAQETKKRAEKLLEKKIVLSFDKNSWTIEDKELIDLLSFKNNWDKEKISAYTKGLSQSIDRPAQNALFQFQEGKVLNFKPAKDGQKLNQEKTNELIIQALNGLEKNEEDKTAKINLPVLLNKAEIATSEVNDLGIKELIGEGNSWFYGSISARIHNIKLAASKLNGILLSPGETFSLNQTIGDISEATGFKQAYIIQQGKTILGDGGGVCQISTTFFRAALDAGLPIEERHPHAYRVSYYEYNSQPGFDASIYAPSADFKFKNDTPAHILIQTSVNTASSKLTVSFYGTSDGRVAYISKARIWDQSPPPPDLYQDDPNLPKGTVKQIDFKAWGAKTAFDWKVTRGDEVLQERSCYSTYRPWQAIYLRGTKE